MSSEDAAEYQKDEADALAFLNLFKFGGKKKAFLDIPINAETYNINSGIRGRCLIINNKDFKKCTRRSCRNGSGEDASKIQSLFNNLGFVVEKFDDVNNKDVLCILQLEAKKNHKNSDSFVCFILTHGDGGILFGTDGMFSTDEVFKPFAGDKCSSLVGKPKIFFMQACHGDVLDKESKWEQKESADSQKMVTLRIPTLADIFAAYSPMPGYYSWQNASNTSQGSWFIDELYTMLMQHGQKMNLLDIITLVNGRVSNKFESQFNDEEKKSMKKYVPYFTSTLTRKFYLPCRSETNHQEQGDNFDSEVPSGLLNQAIDNLNISPCAPEYEMNHSKRGKCLIFNQRDFDRDTEMKHRDGTDVDAEVLHEQFSNLGFDVKVCPSYEKRKIFRTLSEVAKEDHADSDCFVCCILTHGDLGILAARDGMFATNDLFEFFADDKCKSLRGKPKIFFIQACRGQVADEGVKVMVRDSADSEAVSKIPIQADFLIARSTVPGNL